MLEIILTFVTGCIDLARARRADVVHRKDCILVQSKISKFGNETGVKPSCRQAAKRRLADRQGGSRDCTHAQRLREQATSHTLTEASARFDWPDMRAVHFCPSQSER